MLVSSGGTKDNGHKLKQDSFKTGYKELSYHEDTQAVKQVSQEGCALAIFKAQMNEVLHNLI